MKTTITKEIDRCKAKSDDGQIFAVTVFQEFNVVDQEEDFQGGLLRRLFYPTKQIESKAVPGLKFAKTIEGLHLNIQGENKFEIVESGTIITRI